VIEYPFREYKSPLSKGDQNRIVAAYDDEVAYADYQVGRILDYIKAKKRADTTTVVVTADHGEMLGQHTCYGHGYHMWEENLRVPLVIRSTNLTVAGRLDDSPHTHVDIAPSLLALAGIGKIPDELPGVSLFDTRGAENHRIRMSLYNAHDIRRQAVRDNRYKLIHYNKVEESSLAKLNSLRGQIPTADPKDLPSLTASLEGERYELYDLHTDPGEKTNIFEKENENAAVRRLSGKLLEYLEAGESEVGKLSAELIEALKNAGYFVSGDE
jgi:arylsulfatase A-like enzyme